MEAERVFELIYNEDRTNLLALQNLHNLRSKVARWHFRMLNDEKRNREFEKAIHFWVIRGKNKIMDIGTGTGLMSLYASNTHMMSLRNEIYAIESDTIMHSIAEKVISDNQNEICLLHKYSTDLKIPEEIPSMVDLIVSEILDSGAFGEGILETMIHAKKHLLEPYGKIVPWKVKIFVAGYTSKHLCANHIVVNDSFYEYIFTDRMRLIAESKEYDAEYVDMISDFKIITDTIEAFIVNFNSVESMEKYFNGEIVNVQLQTEVESEFLDGFVVWFELYLNENDEENKITTKPKSVSCWQQALFKLKERVLVSQYEIIKISMSCKDGILQINHDLHENSDRIDVEVDQFIIKFLNDEEYLEAIENATYGNGVVENCLDLSPFPYIGFVMLKESRIKRLFCSEGCEDLVKVLAEKNCISLDAIKFFDDSNMLEIADIKFDLIIVNPFQELGDLNNQVIESYKIYQQLLTEGGILIPHKVSLYGELINSEWLTNCCKVTNEQMKALKIDKHINKYSSEIHYELNTIKCHKLSVEFKIADIFWDDKLHECEIKPFMNNISLPINFILLSFKIKMTATSTEFALSRNKKLCCFKKFAQIVDNADSTNPRIKFMQNFGLIKVSCE